jgi:hypothetical protein
MTNPANPLKGKTFRSGRERTGRADKTPEPADIKRESPRSTPAAARAGC